MAIEVVDLPINSMMIFHSYVKVYQRVFPQNMEIKTVLTPPILQKTRHPPSLPPPASKASPKGAPKHSEATKNVGISTKIGDLPSGKLT